MGTAATRAKNKYNKENYERINLVTTPEIKTAIKKAADNENMSVNGFINEILCKQLSYFPNFSVYFGNELVSDVEVGDTTAKIRRYTTHPAKQIFYADEIPRYKLGEILELRCWDRNRADIDECLKKLGLIEYNPYEICRKTHGITYADKLWFRFEGESFDGISRLKELYNV